MPSPSSSPLPAPSSPPLPSAPPGRVVKIVGIIFQSDAASTLGRIIIRPLEALDQWWAGLSEPGVSFVANPSDRNARPKNSPLAMHAGIHVVLEDGREFIVEQLAGGRQDWLVNGLHWTPLAEFRKRDNPAQGGWDVTVPIHAFREIGAPEEEHALQRLNSLQGRAFFHEDCTGLISRVFGSDVRLFADSPVARSLGWDLRSGEPALPLLRRDFPLDPEPERRLQARALRELPDPVAEAGGMSLRQMHHRLLLSCLVFAGLVVAAITALESRRPKPAPFRRRWASLLHSLRES